MLTSYFLVFSSFEAAVIDVYSRPPSYSNSFTFSSDFTCPFGLYLHSILGHNISFNGHDEKTYSQYFWILIMSTSVWHLWCFHFELPQILREVYPCLNIASQHPTCFISVLFYWQSSTLFKVEEGENNFLSILALFVNIVVIIWYITCNFVLRYSYCPCCYIPYFRLQNVIYKTIMKHLYRCTVHFVVYLSNTPTNAHT